jgi:hypothetical protein
MPKSMAQQRAVAKYDTNNYDKILLRVKKGHREEVQEYAKGIGLSLNAFVIQAIQSAMSVNTTMEPLNSIETVSAIERQAIEKSIWPPVNIISESYPDSTIEPPANDANMEPNSDTIIETANSTSTEVIADIIIDLSTDSSIRICLYCGKKIEGKKTKKFCSDNCRIYSHKKNKKLAMASGVSKTI